MLQIKAEFPEKLNFLFKPARYKVAFGGRGSAKSWSFARACLIYALRKRIRILCAREFQNSIADSVHKLLQEQIYNLGLTSYFDIQNTTIKAVTGSEFIFSGLKTNISKIKSLEGADIVWIEEAQAVSKSSWEILIPTIRKNGSEIWVTFNPDLETDPTYQLFVAKPIPGAVVVKINWDENPWFPDVLRKEKDYQYSVDHESAEHVWGGNPRCNSDAEVLRGRYVVERFKPDANNWCGPYFGADWGFGIDPTTLIKCWINERKLYIEYEAYGIGVDLDDTPALFNTIPGSKNYIIRADCARPETISHMRRHGYRNVRACDKWPGSIQDGVEHLRSYKKIVIHPRCIHTLEQAKLWSYKKDKLSNDILPILIDKNNDIWDACRYALGPIIRRGKPVKQRPSVPPKRSDYNRQERTGGDSWKTV
jgi:phage terminase large subunit